MPRWSPFDPDADRRLVKGLNEGDEEALASLYSLYAERIYDYSLTMTWEAKAAAEIVHDTFIDAYRRAPRMRDRVQLRPWLYAAARRRYLQRGRVRGLHWEWGSDTPDAGQEGVPHDEARALFEATLARLDFADQETLVLALRHGLRGPDLAAALGLGPRRVGGQVSKARSRFEAALAAELRSAGRRCMGSSPRALAPEEAGAELAGRTAALDGDPYAAGSGTDALDRHMDACPRCVAWAGLKPAALFGMPSAPVLPAALRYRVIHTGSDPELAGHRADIAARGGNLTPEGLPRQPDVPSPFARRWLVAVGGVVGALVTALVAVLAVGPPLPEPWPFNPKPQPSTSGLPGDGEGRRGSPPPQAGGGQGPGPGGAPGAPDPQLRGRSSQPGYEGAPGPGRTSPPSARSPGPGRLVVGPAEVRLKGGTRVASFQIRADQGPVVWEAQPSSQQLSVSPASGTLTAGAMATVQVTLAASLVKLPGEGAVTFTPESGPAQSVKVKWGLSLL